MSNLELKVTLKALDKPTAPLKGIPLSVKVGTLFGIGL